MNEVQEVNDFTPSLSVTVDYPSQRWLIEATMNLVRTAMGCLCARDDEVCPEFTVLELALDHLNALDAAVLSVAPQAVDTNTQPD